MSDTTRVEITLIVEAPTFDDNYRSEGCHVREFVVQLLSPYMKVIEADSNIADSE